MKALVIAESADAARELSAGARTLADEVVLATFGEAPEAVADKVAVIAVPEGAVVDDAADTLLALADAEGVDVVLVEPTRHLKTVAGKMRLLPRAPPPSPTSWPSPMAPPPPCTSAALPSAP